MDFCKKCKIIMVPTKKTRSTVMKCRKCGYETKKGATGKRAGMKIATKPAKKKDIMVLENDDILLPITEAFCPICENPKAYYWLQQTRAADEPPTQFFRCTKCKHVWREYK
ncbi:MAG: transcription factor S [Candidatus Aenigmatarchaeota archaeon]